MGTAERNANDWHAVDPQLVPTLREEALKRFGFVKQPHNDTQKAAEYLYETQILDGEFLMRIKATSPPGTEEKKNEQGKEPGEIRLATMITEVASGEPYELHLVSTAQGVFVGKVREAHREVLGKMFDRCGYQAYDIEYFFTAISYIMRRYRDALEYPFDKGTEAAIIRAHETGKWYIVTMMILPQKIGMTGERKIKVMNLHGTADEVKALVDGKNFFHGFHMNKKYWYTIKLDGSVPLKELLPLIDKSRAMAMKGKAGKTGKKKTKRETEKRRRA